MKLKDAGGGGVLDWRLCIAWVKRGYLRGVRSQSTYICSTDLCLASSKILTSHPPLPLASVSSPRTKGGGGGYTLAVNNSFYHKDK